MRISNLHKFLVDDIKNNKIELNNTSLVIDGYNFFYNMYKESNLCSLFGCESNFYAKYVRERLSSFQKANVKCYFLFRGGKKTYNDKLLKFQTDENHYEYEPIFALEVYKEVLNDMGFDYAICEYTSKIDCVALAQRLNCPVLAMDIEYFFFGVKYIPYKSLDCEHCTNVLKGKLFSLDQLKDKYQLDNQQIATFIVLFDNRIFSSTFRNNLLRKLRLSLTYQHRYHCFLNWLSRNRESSLKVISELVTEDEYSIIRLELERTTLKYNKTYQPEGLAAKYFLDKHSCAINHCDQEWFSKGVLWKIIPIHYVEIYRNGICLGSWSTEDNDAEDSMLLSAPIIRYGLDLLTNFSDAKLRFKGRVGNRIKNVEESAIVSSDDDLIEIRSTIRESGYGSSNVFDNGWEGLRIYKLFEHFLKESVQVEVSALEKAPSECRLLIAALVYFARRKGVDVNDEAFAVLLSYVMLGAVDEAAGRDGTFDVKHCKLASAFMDDYLKISDKETKCILDRKLLHSLVEFQHCLRNLNFLNTLCGSSLASVVFSRTYNATFVYKVLYDIKRNYNGDRRTFLVEKLKNVSIFLPIVMNLFNIFTEIKRENNV